jgi:serine/threonine protein kinase
MPPVTPLSPGEPARIGAYELTGRLSPAVFATRAADGREVAVKRYPRPLDEPHLEHVAALRRAAAIGTALIVDTGPDFLVSEYIAGPGLEEIGPLEGAALHRTAIALMTSIAALHQAGVAHGNVRPDQVVLGPDGPRLLCYGAPAGTTTAEARSTAADADPEETIDHSRMTDAGDSRSAAVRDPGSAATRPEAVPPEPSKSVPPAVSPAVAEGVSPGETSSGPLEEPAAPGSMAPAPIWRSPEEARGEAVGPAADMFGWAATVIFAATGRPPFTTGGDSATTGEKRLAHGAADLGPLEGDLRQLVADCLAPEPAERPTAEEALLRLIGHTSVLHTVIPTAPPTPATSPSRGRPSALVLAAAGLAIALLSGGTTYALTPRDGGRTGVAATAAPSAAPLTKATPQPAPVTRTPRPSVSPPTPTEKVELPTGGTLYEHPDDPVRIVTLQLTPKGEDSVVYARDPRDDSAFEQVGGDNIAAAVSPDGRRLATLNELFVAESDRLSVSITDRVSGEKSTIPLIELPNFVQTPNWSRDGNRLLMTVMQGGTAKEFAPQGFLVVDVRTRQVRFTQTSNEDDVKEYQARPAEYRSWPYYFWAPNGKEVAAFYLTPEDRYGTRFWNLSGQVVRSMHWTGRLTGLDPFSPSGSSFITSTCERSYVTCVWNTETGERRATVPGQDGAVNYGWYDDDHLILGRWTKKDRLRIFVVNMQGEPVRELAEITAKTGTLVRVGYQRR